MSLAKLSGPGIGQIGCKGTGGRHGSGTRRLGKISSLGTTLWYLISIPRRRLSLGLGSAACKGGEEVKWLALEACRAGAEHERGLKQSWKSRQRGAFW